MLDGLVYLSAAALGCFGIWFFVFQRRERDWERISVLSLSLSLVLVLVLRCFAEFSRDSWDWLFTGIQTVFDVLEGSSEDFRNALSAIPVVPELLSCAVPFLTVFTAVRLLWHYLPHHVPMGRSEWFLFSELDANSIRMAKSIHKDLKKAWDPGVFIFLRTRRGGQTPEILEDIRELNYLLYPKTEARFLRWPHRRHHHGPQRHPGRLRHRPRQGGGPCPDRI